MEQNHDQTNERKDENCIPLSINAGDIKIRGSLKAKHNSFVELVGVDYFSILWVVIF